MLVSLRFQFLCMLSVQLQTPGFVFLQKNNSVSQWYSKEKLPQSEAEAQEKLCVSSWSHRQYSLMSLPVNQLTPTGSHGNLKPGVNPSRTMVTILFFYHENNFHNYLLEITKQSFSTKRKYYLVAPNWFFCFVSLNIRTTILRSQENKARGIFPHLSSLTFRTSLPSHLCLWCFLLADNSSFGNFVF